MLQRILLCFCFVLLSVNCIQISAAVSSKKTTYSEIVTGGTNLRKIQYLNDAVNPSSKEFIQQYIKEGDHVLDLGCGPGLMTQKIAQIVGKKGHVLGIDISNNQINIARKFAKRKNIRNIAFRQGTAYDLSRIKGKFDVVYIRFMLVNMKNPYEIAEQVKKVLKPGGYLLVEDLLGNDVASRPFDYRLELVKKVNKMSEDIAKTDFEISHTYSKFLSRNGYKVVSNSIAQPLLDTMQKRRNLSLSMRELEKVLVKNKKISRARLYSMIKRVEKMEDNTKIELYFYKIGQIAAVLT